MLPLLKGTSQNQAAGPQTLSIARQSKHPAEAMKFIAYFMKAENLAKVAEGDALIPVTTSASAIVKKDLAGKHGWDAILGASASLVDSPWNKATKFPQWKSETATPAYQEFLGGQDRLGDAAEAAHRRLDQGQQLGVCVGTAGPRGRPSRHDAQMSRPSRKGCAG